MEIFERIKYLRKDCLHKTQEEFASAIKVSRSNLASIEIGRISVTDRVISDVCREFNVNEEWLRTGEGEMFIEIDPDEELLEWAGNVLVNESDTYKYKFLKMLANLSDEEWKLMEKFFNVEIMGGKNKDKEDEEEKKES